MLKLVAAFAATFAASAAPQAHHRAVAHHHAGCRTSACDTRIDRLYARRHQPRWVIPTAIVMCESKGQNLAPNSASAAGYYQITAGTWPEGGGRAPDDASQHSKAEQDAVAARLWAGGAGASRWVCKA